MDILTILIILSATAAYVILIKQAIKKGQTEKERLSFSSFFLWSIIDLIMLVNTIRANNDYVLILTYTILTIVLTIILLLKKQFQWSKSDTLVAGVACICLIVSYLTSPIIGVTAGALSISFAGIPNLINISKQEPNKSLYWIIFFFLLSPFFSFISVTNEDGAIKDYIYPCIAILYWLIALILTFTGKRERA